MSYVAKSQRASRSRSGARALFPCDKNGIRRKGEKAKRRKGEKSETAKRVKISDMAENETVEEQMLMPSSNVNVNVNVNVIHPNELDGGK